MVYVLYQPKVKSRVRARVAIEAPSVGQPGRCNWVSGVKGFRGFSS